MQERNNSMILIKTATFFMHRSFKENLLLLHSLIARLSSEIAAFFAFRHFRRQLVCLWMHSDVHFCFPLLSFSLCQPLYRSLSPITAFHSLTSASSAVALQFSHLLHLPVAVFGFSVVLLLCCRPLIRSLQLVVTIVGLPLVYFSFS